jgi:hypothetical protein
MQVVGAAHTRELFLRKKVRQKTFLTVNFYLASCLNFRLAETPCALTAPRSRRGQREPGNIRPGKAGQTFPCFGGTG